MALSTGLIVKGLLGIGAASGVITLAVKGKDIFYRNTGIEEKKKSLGLPESCKWPTGSETSKDCDNLTGDDLKGINFDGKGNATLTVEPSSGTPAPTSTLTIEKVTDSDFPQDYKFIFKTTSETGITIKKENNPLVTLKKGMNLEFKIKEEGGKWSLEKAWDISKLADKVGMENCIDSTKKCTIKTGKKINVINSSNKKITDLNVSADNSDISYEIDQKDYNQGIQFTIGSTAVSLSGGTPESGASTITSLDSTQKYQIIKDGDKWYLSQKS